MTSPARRRRTAAAASAILAALLLGAAPTAFARDDSVTSFDGTKIALHHFTAAGLADGAQAPTVLMGPGWSSPGDADPNSQTLTTAGFPGVGTLRKAGYNVLTWDPRGFGSSGGSANADSPAVEGRDVQALLDYVARQPQSQLDGPDDPRVGMTGGSYGGGIQLDTAAIDKRVDAIVPDIAWHSLVTSLYKDQTVKTGWASILFATGHARGRLDSHVDSAFSGGIANGTLSDEDVAWFASRGPGDLVDRIRIPTLFVQGTTDTLFTLQEAITNYAILRRNGVPTKMLWFCGGHAACLTPAGDTARIERDTLAWLGRYVKADKTVGTGPRFEWLDQDGRSFEATDYPLASATPLSADGTGTLALTQAGGSGPAVPPDPSNEIGVLAAPVAATKATNAVDVTIPAPAADRVIAGAPQVTLTYAGTGAPADTRVLAQVVDDATGKVLGNQITPIPVTLDGAEHTITRPLEVVAATAHPASTFTLQVVAASTAYNIQRSGGTVDFSKIHVELPVADLAAKPPGYPSDAKARSCASRRTLTLHLKRRYRGRVRSARVLAGRKLLARLRKGSSAIRISFAGREKGTASVRIVMRLRDGRTVTDVRRYRLCVRR